MVFSTPSGRTAKTREPALTNEVMKREISEQRKTQNRIRKRGVGEI